MIGGHIVSRWGHSPGLFVRQICLSAAHDELFRAPIMPKITDITRQKTLPAKEITITAVGFEAKGGKEAKYVIS